MDQSPRDCGTNMRRIVSVCLKIRKVLSDMCRNQKQRIPSQSLNEELHSWKSQLDPAIQCAPDSPPSTYILQSAPLSNVCPQRILTLKQYAVLLCRNSHPALCSLFRNFYIGYIPYEHQLPHNL